MQFGTRSALVKEYGESAVHAVMDQIGQLFSANIRSNDLAFRYEATTVALVLGDTGEKEALLAVEKLRRLLKEVRLPGKDQSVEFCAALAQAVMRQHFDPVDIVTEVVNRADHALELAIGAGSGKDCLRGRRSLRRLRWRSHIAQNQDLPPRRRATPRKSFAGFRASPKTSSRATAQKTQAKSSKLAARSCSPAVNSQVGFWPAISSVEQDSSRTHVETWRHCDCQWGAHALWTLLRKNQRLYGAGTGRGRGEGGDSSAAGGIDPKEFDHVVFGNAQQTSGDALYGARHVGLRAGLPIETPALTVNRLCGSGMQAIVSAAQMIQTDEAKVVLAGGMESMSQAPFSIRGRDGFTLAPGGKLEDSLMVALLDSYCGMHMASTAELYGEQQGITRQAQDEFALRSQQNGRRGV